jgi:hypothetical protein
MHLRLEWLAIGVVPGIGRYVLPVDEYRARFPVVRFAGQEIAALQQQDLLPEGASVCASVPPPAPVPMMMTS